VGEFTAASKSSRQSGAARLCPPQPGLDSHSSPCSSERNGEPRTNNGSFQNRQLPVSDRCAGERVLAGCTVMVHQHLERDSSADSRAAPAGTLQRRRCAIRPTKMAARTATAAINSKPDKSRAKKTDVNLPNDRVMKAWRPGNCENITNKGHEGARRKPLEVRAFVTLLPLAVSGLRWRA